jgi:hypothetical protein
MVLEFRFGFQIPLCKQYVTEGTSAKTKELLEKFAWKQIKIYLLILKKDFR